MSLSTRKLNIAIIGATGMVGREFISIFNQLSFAATFYLFASAKSAGTQIIINDIPVTVEELSEANLISKPLDVVFLATTSALAAVYAPLLAKRQIYCIDNSSFFRQHDDVPLVIPPLNGDIIKQENYIISIPNCSTIQAIMPLKYINERYQLTKVIYSTYQSVSGSGKKGIDDLIATKEGQPPSYYPHRIYNNIIPQIETFIGCDTKEEVKMIKESMKILQSSKIAFGATCVRVPLFYTHAIAIYAETVKEIEPDILKKELAAQEQMIVIDEPDKELYPLAEIARGRNEVFIGRIRNAPFSKNTIMLWIVADNLRRGAAYTGFEILQVLLRKNYVGRNN